MSTHARLASPALWHICAAPRDGAGACNAGASVSGLCGTVGRSTASEAEVEDALCATFCSIDADFLQARAAAACDPLVAHGIPPSSLPRLSARLPARRRRRALSGSAMARPWCAPCSEALPSPWPMSAVSWRHALRTATGHLRPANRRPSDAQPLGMACMRAAADSRAVLGRRPESRPVEPDGLGSGRVMRERDLEAVRSGPALGRSLLHCLHAVCTCTCTCTCTRTPTSTCHMHMHMHHAHAHAHAHAVCGCARDDSRLAVAAAAPLRRPQAQRAGGDQAHSVARWTGPLHQRLLACRQPPCADHVSGPSRLPALLTALLLANGSHMLDRRRQARRLARAR